MQLLWYPSFIPKIVTSLDSGIPFAVFLLSLGNKNFHLHWLRWVSCAGGTEQKPRVSCEEFDLGAGRAMFGLLVRCNCGFVCLIVFVSLLICSLHPSVSGTWQPEEYLDPSNGIIENFAKGQI